MSHVVIGTPNATTRQAIALGVHRRFALRRTSRTTGRYEWARRQSSGFLEWTPRRAEASEWWDPDRLANLAVIHEAVVVARADDVHDLPRPDGRHAGLPSLPCNVDDDPVGLHRASEGRGSST